jgi:hypothetical protein
MKIKVSDVNRALSSCRIKNSDTDIHMLINMANADYYQLRLYEHIQKLTCSSGDCDYKGVIQHCAIFMAYLINNNEKTDIKLVNKIITKCKVDNEHVMLNLTFFSFSFLVLRLQEYYKLLGNDRRCSTLSSMIQLIAIYMVNHDMEEKK